jgi:6-pyruvoyltetrahydropterin/6-carboxytetrahydropterin synthase
LEVVIDGPFDATAGMIMDFAALDEVVEREVLNDCDHCYLNEFLPNPTVENLIAWIWDRLELKLSLRRIRLWETSRGFAELEH